MNIGYKLVKNNMPATAAVAPYLGMAIPVGSLAYDNILKEMISAGTKMTQPTAKYLLDALYEYAAETIAEEVVRINLGSVSIYPMIDGSFDTEDAPFDPERNTLYVGASIAQELRDLLAGIAPDYAEGQSAGTVKLHSEMDVASQVFKVIDGENPFRLAGANLTVPDGEDESLALYAKDGLTKIADIVVSETDGGQRITCHVKRGEAAVPKGAYKVRLASHGLDPTDPLTISMVTVTLIAEVPAEEQPSPWAAESEDGTVKIRPITEPVDLDAPFAIDGENVGFNIATNRGIIDAVALVGDTHVMWSNASTSGEDVTTANFSPDPIAPEERPAPGTYQTAVTFRRRVTGAEEEAPEELRVENFTVVVA